jgi:hypothetical protein
MHVFANSTSFSDCGFVAMAQRISVGTVVLPELQRTDLSDQAPKEI